MRSKTDARKKLLQKMNSYRWGQLWASLFELSLSHCLPNTRQERVRKGKEKTGY